MALGSSAPEILLSVFATVGDLYSKPPVLGASTIVGSASFNLLVITGVSILAVGEEPKKVKDTGVFAVTSIASLFAYIWLYLVLDVMTPNEVTMVEGWLTLIYFVVLILLAYGADKLNNYFEQKSKTESDIEDQNAADDIKIKKNALRQIAQNIGGENSFSIVVEIAQGVKTAETKKVSEEDQKQIIQLYREILEVNDLSEVQTIALLNQLQPDSLLERFAYRKQAGMNANNKEFLKLKNSKGQIESSNHNV